MSRVIVKVLRQELARRGFARFTDEASASDVLAYTLWLVRQIVKERVKRWPAQGNGVAR